MNWNKNVALLHDLKSGKIYRSLFYFQGVKIIVIYDSRLNNNKLVVIFEENKYILVHNFLFKHENDNYKVMGYIQNLNLVPGVYGKKDNKLDDFYTRLSREITVLYSKESQKGDVIDELNLSHQLYRNSISKFNSKKPKKKLNTNLNIYFNHIRKTPMSKPQEKKIKEIFSYKDYIYLKKNGCTAIFYPDHTKQKKPIINHEDLQI